MFCKYFLHLLACVAVVSHAHMSDGICPDSEDWEEMEDTCVLYKPDALAQWNWAKEKCNDYGGGRDTTMSSIHSLEDNTYVYERLRDVSLLPPGQGVWLGLKRITLEGEWFWEDRTGVDFTNWAQDQPEDEEYYNCVVMDTTDLLAEWHTEDCRNLNGYMCEVGKGEIVPTAGDQTTMDATTESADGGANRLMKTDSLILMTLSLMLLILGIV